MTDFLNKIINIAKSAQSDRIISQAAKEKRDRLLPSFTTYQGIDPKDGTDKVMINGETNSGFKLISNAPLSIGERVYLRPNQSGGLQRVDARNVAPEPVVTALPTPPPTSKRFQILLESIATINMWTSEAGSSSDLAPIPYNENGFFIPATYAENIDLFGIPSFSPVRAGVDIGGGVIVNFDFGDVSASKGDPYFPDPYQFFRVGIFCESNYTLNLNTLLYQESPAPDAYFYSSSVISETWLAIGDIVDESSFSLIYTHTHSSIDVSGAPSPINLTPFTYTAGGGGDSLSCPSPTGLVYTFFVRFKEVSKSNWFEL